MAVEYSKTCDVFSYGVVMWEMVTHKVPFEELHGVFNIQKAIVEGKVCSLCNFNPIVHGHFFPRCLQSQLLLKEVSLS